MALSRTSSPPSSDPGRETTNERASSATNIPTPQTQHESGYTDDRIRNSDNQTGGIILTHKAVTEIPQKRSSASYAE